MNIEEIIRERDEALAFARSETKRNQELAYDNNLHAARERKNWEVAHRLSALLKENGYHDGSYCGVRVPITFKPIGDRKYTPMLEVVEEFVTHLLGRIDELEKPTPQDHQTTPNPMEVAT